MNLQRRVKYVNELESQTSNPLELANLFTSAHSPGPTQFCMVCMAVLSGHCSVADVSDDIGTPI
jgi:hypothetical protein